jgi:hypothetical protein
MVTKRGVIFSSALLFLLLFINTAGCSGLKGLIKRSEDRAFLTPVAEETLQAYRVGAPVRNKLQAMTAAQAWLRFYPSFRYVPPIRIVSAEQMKYREAKLRIAQPDQDTYYSILPDTYVWLVVFNGEFQIIPGESHGTPYPAGTGCVSMIVDASDGSVLRGSGVKKCSL